MTPTRGGLVGRIKRFFASSAELAEHERADAAAEAGVEKLTCCTVRHKVTLQGVIENVSVTKQHGSGWLEAELNDGSAMATLVWMGRSDVPGVEVGRQIRVRGRLAGRDDGFVLYNPEYVLL